MFVLVGICLHHLLFKVFIDGHTLHEAKFCEGPSVVIV